MEFARLGFEVFPLYYGMRGKLRPYGWAKNEVIDAEKASKAIPATSDIGIISQWPTLVRNFYDSEVCGFGVLGNTCVILDIDVKDNKPGIDQFRTMVQEYGVPKPTMITRSKSGGLHAYYRRPKKYISATIKTFAGAYIGAERFNAVDVRGDGGFVVGPDLLVDTFEGVPTGLYATLGLKKVDDLPEFPEGVLARWLKATPISDLDSMVDSYSDDPNDFMSMIRRGLIPNFVPHGARNDAFYMMCNVLKSKGVPKEACLHMCRMMEEKCEHVPNDPLYESVNIESMVERIYVTQEDNPQDVAVDLINRGLYQIMGHKFGLQYVILEDNPYIVSRNMHSASDMKTLLAKHSREFVTPSGKSKMLNPMDLIPKLIHDAHKVDSVGFRAGAGSVFKLRDDYGSRTFLNTYRPIILPETVDERDLYVWDEFLTLISRLFGPEGSNEYRLGLDFVAWLVQRPHIKPSVAIFLMSRNRGVGKSLLFNVLAEVLGTSKNGEPQGRMIKLDELSGRFYDPTGCILNMIDEVQFAVHRNTRQESVTFWRHLKNLITAEMVSVEIKGGAVFQAPNTASMMLAGNSGGFFPIEEFDRRLWIIDANAPLLELGTVDTLFSLVKKYNMEYDDRQRLLGTLRFMLNKHEIKMNLDSIRAPMTDVKREMYVNSLSAPEEWFVEYFDDKEHMLSKTPVISKSALVYLMALSGIDSLVEHPSEGIRLLKQRGHIQVIKSQTGGRRQFRNVPQVALNGLISGQDKEDLFSVRDHDRINKLTSDEILKMLFENLSTIKQHRQRAREAMNQHIKEGFNE